MTSPEDLRRAILAALYPTRAIAVPVSRVVREVRHDGHETDTESVERELEFLASAQLAEAKTEPLGSSRYWQLTAAGILHYERHR